MKVNRLSVVMLIALSLFGSLAGAATRQVDMTALDTRLKGLGVLIQRISDVQDEGSKFLLRPLLEELYSRESSGRLSFLPGADQSGVHKVLSPEIAAPCLELEDRISKREVQRQAMFQQYEEARETLAEASDEALEREVVKMLQKVNQLGNEVSHLTKVYVKCRTNIDIKQ